MTDTGLWVGPDSAPDTYRLVDVLGAGGEGAVWRGMLQLSQSGVSTVAVKVQPATGEPEEAQRWDRYGRLLRSLRHPGLVSVIDCFIGAGMHHQGDSGQGRYRYLVMNYVSGSTLSEWIDENPGATAGARLAMLRTAASALDALHSGAMTAVPVSHGDVKPVNIVIDSQTGAPILVDLGLTRLSDTTGVSGRTNAYAAPELRGDRAQATPQADSFAFAATAAHVLVGQRLPTDESGFLDSAALRIALNQSPATSRRPALTHHVLSALSVPADQRPQDLTRWLAACTDSLSQTTGALSQQDVNVSTVLNRNTAALPLGPTVSGNARRRHLAWPGFAVAGLLVAALATFIVLRGGSSPSAGANAATTTPSATTSFSASPLPTESSTPLDSPTAMSPTATDSTALPADSSSPEPTDITTGSDPVLTSQVLGTDISPSNTSGNAWHIEGPGVIAGQPFDQVVSMGWCSGCLDSSTTTGTAEFDLGNRDWKWFRTVAGQKDSSSQSTGSFRFIVQFDGVTKFSQIIPFGQPVKVNLPLKGALRVRLTVTKVGDNVTASTGFGNPRVSLT